MHELEKPDMYKKIFYYKRDIRLTFQRCMSRENRTRVKKFITIEAQANVLEMHESRKPNPYKEICYDWCIWRNILETYELEKPDLR